MFTKHHIVLTLCVFLVWGCASSTNNDINSEPALAVLGGAIMGTQSKGLTAMARPKRAPPLKRAFDLLNLIPEAFAQIAPVCPDMTGGTCVGNVLQVNMANCQPSGPTRSGYWHSYITYTFPTPASCASALASGFSAATIAGLGGQTFTRDWGQSELSFGNNIRVANDGIVSYFYSAFPSGWQDTRVGGVEISYETGTRRRIVVQGIHAIGVSHTSPPVPDPANFDLTTLSTGTNGYDPAASHVWDHTINTVKTGDSLFSVGPKIDLSGGTVTYGSFANNSVASFDGDIIVEGNTVAAGATLRAQHNISNSIGILTVTQPLVYGDPSCCWPTAGAVRMEYDRNLRCPTTSETLVFRADTCGSIDYSNAFFSHTSRTLNQCF